MFILGRSELTPLKKGGTELPFLRGVGGISALTEPYWDAFSIIRGIHAFRVFQ